MRLTRRRWITVLSLLGIGVSGYLTYTHFSGAAIFCGGASSCELVNSSRFAYLGSVPVALLGLGMYVALTGLSLISVNEERVWPDQAIFAISLIGALYSLYLTYVELFVLYAVCWWCATSAALILFICLLALPRFSRSTAS